MNTLTRFGTTLLLGDKMWQWSPSSLWLFIQMHGVRNTLISWAFRRAGGTGPGRGRPDVDSSYDSLLQLPNTKHRVWSGWQYRTSAKRVGEVRGPEDHPWGCCCTTHARAANSHFRLLTWTKLGHSEGSVLTQGCREGSSCEVRGCPQWERQSEQPDKSPINARKLQVFKGPQ